MNRYFFLSLSLSSSLIIVIVKQEKNEIKSWESTQTEKEKKVIINNDKNSIN